VFGSKTLAAEVYILGLGVLSILLILLGIGADFVTNITGFLYPAFKSF